jgi:Domain of unknown function (DUF4272)
MMTDSKANIRDARAIAERVTALFSVALFSEAILSPEGSYRSALSYFERVDEVYGVRRWLTPEERDYIENEDNEQMISIQFAWKYECCEVLLWALGLIDELTYPDSICDVSRIAKLFLEYDSFEDLMEHVSVRTKDELLDGADLILRYDWACVDARVNEKEMPGGLDKGVVRERHYAFNWIIGANDGADWDDIRPHT